MSSYSLPITDTEAGVSPVLKRMRLDGLDRVTLPFAEAHVQAWLGGTQHTSTDPELLVNVIKVCFITYQASEAAKAAPAHLNEIPKMPSWMLSDRDTTAQSIS